MADGLVAVFEIKHYMVIWRQVELRDFDGVQAQIRGLVRCSGSDSDGQSYRLDVYFLTADSPSPAPQVEIAQRRATLFMPVNDLPPLVDILRNEKPVYGHLRGDRPEWTSIITKDQPVGTGDEDHRPGD